MWVAGIDGTGQRLATPSHPHSEDVVMVVDVGTGHWLEVRLLEEDDAEAAKPLIRELE